MPGCTTRRLLARSRFNRDAIPARPLRGPQRKSSSWRPAVPSVPLLTGCLARICGNDPPEYRTSHQRARPVATPIAEIMVGTCRAKERVTEIATRRSNCRRFFSERRREWIDHPPVLWRSNFKIRGLTKWQTAGGGVEARWMSVCKLSCKTRSSAYFARQLALFRGIKPEVYPYSELLREKEQRGCLLKLDVLLINGWNLN